MRRWPLFIAFASLVLGVAFCLGPAPLARASIADAPAAPETVAPPGSVGVIGPSAVRPGQRVTFRCDTVCEDPQPSLCLWSATGGRVHWRLDAPESSTWTAPRATGTYTVACQVAGRQGQSRLHYRTVTVQ